MEIKKFNEYRNMMVLDEPFDRLINVLDLVNKNCMLINSLYAGLKDRYERENAYLWKTSYRVSSVKEELDEVKNDWRQLIVNINEHFKFDYERGAVNYNPQSLLQNTERIDYDLKRVIAICSNEELMKYFEKIQEVNRDNNEQIRNELDLNREDNLESYWNAENFEILRKSVESFSSSMSFCQIRLLSFVEDNQIKKSDENNIQKDDRKNEVIKLVQDISELEEQRSAIDKQINEKLNKLNAMLQSNEKNLENDFENNEIQKDETDTASNELSF